MQGMVDETFCGPVCQHPSCWQSQRRCNRGLPRTRYSDLDSESEDEGMVQETLQGLLESVQHFLCNRSIYSSELSAIFLLRAHKIYSNLELILRYLHKRNYVYLSSIY